MGHCVWSLFTFYPNVVHYLWVEPAGRPSGDEDCDLALQPSSDGALQGPCLKTPLRTSPRPIAPCGAQRGNNPQLLPVNGHIPMAPANVASAQLSPAALKEALARSSSWQKHNDEKQKHTLQQQLLVQQPAQASPEPALLTPGGIAAAPSLAQLVLVTALTLTAPAVPARPCTQALLKAIASSKAWQHKVDKQRVAQQPPLLMPVREVSIATAQTAIVHALFAWPTSATVIGLTALSSVLQHAHLSAQPQLAPLPHATSQAVQDAIACSKQWLRQQEPLNVCHFGSADVWPDGCRHVDPANCRNPRQALLRKAAVDATFDMQQLPPPKPAPDLSCKTPLKQTAAAGSNIPSCAYDLVSGGLHCACLVCVRMSVACIVLHACVHVVCICIATAGSNSNRCPASCCCRHILSVGTGGRHAGRTYEEGALSQG